MSFLITAILGVILAGVGGILVVSLSGPLNSLKDMFIAFINLICNNTIWFVFFILLFMIVVSILKKIKPFEFKSLRQQHFENNLQKQNLELNKSKLDFENNLQKQNLELNKSKVDFDKKKFNIDNRYRHKVLDLNRTKQVDDAYYKRNVLVSKNQHTFAIDNLKDREMTLREKKFKEEKKKNKDWRKLSK